MLPALQATTAKPVETAPQGASAGKGSGRPKREPKGIRIQVFASQSRKEAEDMAAKLTGWGYPAGIEEVDLADKGVWYRIRLQPFATRKEATEAGEKMLSEGLIKGYWVVP
jgi:cell division septation protein DedD